MNFVFITITLFSFLLSQTSARSRIRRQNFVFPDEGERCQTPRNQQGNCIPFRECSALSGGRDFSLLRDSICGYDGNAPRLCCPSTRPVVREPTTTSTTTTTTERPRIQTPETEGRNPPVMRKPSILPENCGNSTVPLPRIIGGSPAELAAWPWLVAVYVTRTGLGRGTDCGGVLVTDRHVITAAHCVTDRRGNAMSASTFTIRAGEHILNDDNDGAAPVDVPVANIVRHENFQRRVFRNDIAILTLQRSVGFNRFVRPICLPYDQFTNDNLVNRSAFVAGWGTTAFDGDYSPILSQIQIPVWSNGDCNNVYRAERVPITREYLCAGVSDGTKDSCQGDSGGPLMLPSISGRFYLVGIVSFGKRCATVGYPGVYTRVSIYLDWIASNLT